MFKPRGSKWLLRPVKSQKMARLLKIGYKLASANTFLSSSKEGRTSVPFFTSFSFPFLLAIVTEYII